MGQLVCVFNRFHNALFNRLQCFDGLAPLALRLYLVPVFWMAGTQKIDMATFLPFDYTVQWFDDGLGLPFPYVMAFLAGWTEILGAVLLLMGLATRWISIPLMVTMIVAALAVHWDQGWSAIASSESRDIAIRLGAAREILEEHADYGWLTEKGGFVILNNGIEFSVTYFIMLMSLMFTGGGRFTSVDYWLMKSCKADH